jgi:GTP-binding protein HflX
LDTLRTLDVDPDVPMIEVLNKVDLLDPADAGYLQALHKDDDKVFGISAVTGEGLDRLLDDVTTHIAVTRRKVTLELDWAMGAAQSALQREGVIEAETQTDTGWTLDVRWTAQQQAQFEKQFPEVLGVPEDDVPAEEIVNTGYHPLD